MLIILITKGAGFKNNMLMIKIKDSRIIIVGQEKDIHCLIVCAGSS